MCFNVRNLLNPDDNFTAHPFLTEKKIFWKKNRDRWINKISRKGNVAGCSNWISRHLFKFNYRGGWFCKIPSHFGRAFFQPDAFWMWFIWKCWPSNFSRTIIQTTTITREPGVSQAVSWVSNSGDSHETPRTSSSIQLVNWPSIGLGKITSFSESWRATKLCDPLGSSCFLLSEIWRKKGQKIHPMLERLVSLGIMGE